MLADLIQTSPLPRLESRTSLPLICVLVSASKSSATATTTHAALAHLFIVTLLCYNIPAEMDL